jgi:ribonuclease-3
MDNLNNLKKNLKNIQKSINYFFKNENILIEAFVHKSYINEHKDIEYKDNERLEFLGDSVFSLIISEYLFKKLNSPEGKLSHIRSLIVNALSCELFFKKLKFESYILLSKGEIKEKRKKTSILADTFEALLGSIYLDGGLDVAKSFLFDNFEKYFLEIIKNPILDSKSKLQEHFQKVHNVVPEYKLIDVKGPEHEKTFYVEVYVEDKLLGSGRGLSKKIAEQKAAGDALNNLN